MNQPTDSVLFHLVTTGQNPAAPPAYVLSHFVPELSAWTEWIFRGSSPKDHLEDTLVALGNTNISRLNNLFLWLLSIENGEWLVYYCRCNSEDLKAVFRTLMLMCPELKACAQSYEQIHLLKVRDANEPKHP